MSAAPAVPLPEEERPSPASRPAESASGVLARLAAFLLALTVLSHALLVNSPAFLSFCQRWATSPSAQPLWIEASLRSLAPGEAELLLVGSSLVASNLAPEMLARRLGMAEHGVVALPLYGGNAVDAAMLGPLLARARPRAVVHLATVWTLFDRAPADELRLYDPGVALSLFTWRELLGARQAHASRLLGSAHFAIRHRAALREAAAAALVGEPPFPRGGGNPVVHERRRARTRAAADQFTCPNVQTRALDLLADRLEAAGVLLVLVATPVNDAHERDSLLRRQRDACLAGLADRPGVALVPAAALPAFVAGDFSDALHMNGRGALRFTNTVGDHLAVILGARRGPNALQ